jgi:hypothetical protein
MCWTQNAHVRRQRLERASLYRRSSAIEHGHATCLFDLPDEED